MHTYTLQHLSSSDQTRKRARETTSLQEHGNNPETKTKSVIAFGFDNDTELCMLKSLPVQNILCYSLQLSLCVCLSASVCGGVHVSTFTCIC